MANGHGGARPGSGPKRGPDGKALKPYQRRERDRAASESSRTPAAGPLPQTTPAEARRPLMSEGAVHAIIEAARELQSRSRMKPRTPEWNPYVIRPDRFGYVSEHIKKRRPTLAMDDNSALMQANQFAVNAWQAGGAIANDASDGMLFLGYPYLSQLVQRPEFRLFGEIMSEEMTRKWIDIRGTDDESTKEKDKPKDKNKDDKEAEDRRLARDEEPRTDDRNKEIERKILELKDFLTEIKVRDMFKTMGQHDSDFGIGHLYLDLKGANIDDLRDPENAKSIGNGRDAITKNKLGKGCLLGLRAIEPVWCYPTSYNAANPLSPDWYDPQVWYVMGAEIHKTRLLPFIGRPVPDILKPAYAFGGLSMSQMAQPYVDIWLRTRESVGEIVHAFSVMILSTNMGTTTQPGGAGGGGGDVLARMMLANMLRDNQGMMVIDRATEDFKNISAPISGLDELQAQAQEHMFSVGRIPGVKFAGITPKGLNASSEGELRAFNDTVHGRQEQLFRTPLSTILDIAQVSLWGARDPDITYDFLPLYEETEKEKAEIRKLEAETDQIWVDSGVVSQEEAREKLAADPESGYHGINPDDVPDLLEEEEGGLIPEGAGKGLEAELGQAEAGGAKPPAAGKRPGAQPFKEKKPEAGADDAADVDLSLFETEEDRDVKDPQARDGAPAIAAGIVHRSPDGKVLLLRRSADEPNYGGHWAIPGGKADGDETPEQAARRENREEMGDHPIGKLRHLHEKVTPTGMRFHTFLHDTKRFNPHLNNEHDGFVWADPQDLPQPMHPAVKALFSKTLASDEWNESDHPRGQPGNVGQFGSGGGGSGGRAARERQHGEGSGARTEQAGERSAGGARQMGEKGGARQAGEREGGGAEKRTEKRTPQASQLYTPPTKTVDQIVAAFPGGAEAIVKTRARLAAVVPSDALVSEGGFRNPDGTYTPEREELHRKIAASFFPPEKVARALPAPGEKPVLIMLGGRGGSGKSWLTGEHGPVDESKAILLDSDAIKAMLPGYEGWNASAFHEESSHVLAMADKRALELGVNTIHDATLKSEATAVMRMATYEAAGYEVEGYYMYAAPETAAMRAMARYAKGGKFNGRFVPPEIILDNVNNEKNFDKLSGGFRKWAVYDNNAEGKEGPKLVSRSHDD